MDFANKKRQQFLTESYYVNMLQEIDKSRVFWLSDFPESDSKAEGESLKASIMARNNSSLFFLQYTAGIDLEILRYRLEDLIISYEVYTDKLKDFEKELKNKDFNSVSPLSFFERSQYEKVLQLVGLCFLLHRTDLLLRLAKLVDPSYYGWDAVYEELLAYQLDGRYYTEDLRFYEPYQLLIDIMFNDSDEERLNALSVYLFTWYPSFKDEPWYGSHERIIDNEGNYYGYWSFEAGALVFLNRLDDSEISHMVYPKDLVQFAREFVPSENDISNPSVKTLRCEAGQICPKTGEWFCPTHTIEKRHIQQGDVMPEIPNNTWGKTIWYMTE